MTLTAAPPSQARSGPRTEPVPITAVPPTTRTMPVAIDRPIPEPAQQAGEPADGASAVVHRLVRRTPLGGGVGEHSRVHPAPRADRD